MTTHTSSASPPPRPREVPGPRGAAGWAGRLWDAVAAGDEQAAVRTAFAVLDAGLDPEAFLLDVLAAVQRRVGTEWAANRMTVAQEHTATAINERVMAALAHHPAARTGAAHGPVRGRVTVACVDGEWHALPARLLAEVLRLRGWRVDFLGAQVPLPHLVEHLHLTGADAVALSGSLATRLPTAHATIAACQAAGVPVLAGGAAFGPDGRYARLCGADGWAPDARGAAGRLERPLVRPAAHQAAGGLPHLADQEYTLVTRSARRLVRETFTGLLERFPALREYDERQREHTAQDLAHLVDFLAAALYTDDAALFTSFLTWTADVLTARGVPARSLLPALDLLGDGLRDLPRATAVIGQGRDALTHTLSGPGRPV
ncbi:cobalamin-dependent protein [Streptomyces sp. TRM 70351]|uniref:cobalamin B12-binding domain-containing protein n=1 Tax=Streptomyces sp. TRM 70351 TaxID=3116552 RepID=UPI002E7B672A|nr:cobalamin-dependent protein [Streptomyces sp. TRM 70351]MEE1930501.1 cobalamin-dependent protein [Streptomyces sp. TRM 70351]